ncbi:MAG: cobyrinate a,c-diamide synthase [Dermatophilaceae bacterium]|nr:cobyrinate a,c-diamide synthase [Dermatophilaceae bacterium]
MRLPRVLIAAPGSGQGKTMVTTGLMAALTDRGLDVSPHKVGPDFIDPGYHSAACGRPGRNLDPYLQGEQRVPALLVHAALTPAAADIAVIEGAMGLFDGALGTGGFSSSAHVARLVAAPVVLVVDCASVARSVGAIVHGFSRFDDRVRVAGVILNNLGSARHEAETRQGVAETGVPVLGVIPRLPQVVVPSRHLGLIPVAERQPAALEAVAALSSMAREYLDLDALIELAGTAPDLEVPQWDPAAEVAKSGTRPARAPRIAVAGGAAFTFGYAETSELLVAAGAEVVGFDPLRDESLPSGVSGLLIGGGFPEIHASDLAANTTLRSEIRQFADGGGAISAECAGLLYLGRELDGAPMCGVLPLTARMAPRLTLGYRSAVALADNVLCAAGQRVSGHEFHRTQVVADSEDTALAAWAWQDGSGRPVTEGLAQGAVHASYLHLHWAGYPALATRFVSHAGEVA